MRHLLAAGLARDQTNWNPRPVSGPSWRASATPATVPRGVLERDRRLGAVHVSTRTMCEAGCGPPQQQWPVSLRLALFKIRVPVCNGPSAPVTRRPGSGEGSSARTMDQAAASRQRRAAYEDKAVRVSAILCVPSTSRPVLEDAAESQKGWRLMSSLPSSRPPPPTWKSDR